MADNRRLSLLQHLQLLPEVLQLDLVVLTFAKCSHLFVLSSIMVNRNCMNTK